MHIVIVNTKGGSGKTLIATQLASYYAQQGRKVALCDHDNQRSSVDWVQARPKTCAPIHYVAAYAGEQLKKLASVVIHDMPAGYDISALRSDVPQIDKLIIPIVPGPTDLRAAWRFCMLLSYTGLLGSDIDIGFVVNRYKANAVYNERVMEFLNRLDVPVVGYIRDTQNYIHAGNRGLGIFDLPAYRTQADRRAWQPVINWLETAETSFARQLMDELASNRLQPA